MTEIVFRTGYAGSGPVGTGWAKIDGLLALWQGNDSRVAPAAGLATDAHRASARNKPSSVPLRGRIIHLGPLSPTASSSLPGTQAGRAVPSPPIWPCSEWGLPCGPCYQRPGALLPHPFTLACAACAAIGGLLSVALSVALRRPGVTRHPALRSSDFPPPTEVGGDPHSYAHRKDRSKAVISEVGCESELEAREARGLIALEVGDPVIAIVSPEHRAGGRSK